jgi:hypothetical protein
MLLLPFKKEMLLLQFLWEVLSNGSQQGNFYPSISTLGPEENSICETIIFFREVIFFQEKLFFIGTGAGAPRSSTKLDLFFMYI